MVLVKDVPKAPWTFSLAYIFHACDTAPFGIIVNIYYLRSIDPSTPENSDFLI